MLDLHFSDDVALWWSVPIEPETSRIATLLGFEIADSLQSLNIKALDEKLVYWRNPVGLQISILVDETQALGQDQEMLALAMSVYWWGIQRFLLTGRETHYSELLVLDDLYIERGVGIDHDRRFKAVLAGDGMPDLRRRPRAQGHPFYLRTRIDPDLASTG